MHIDNRMGAVALLVALLTGTLPRGSVAQSDPEPQRYETTANRLVKFNDTYFVDAFSAPIIVYAPASVANLPPIKDVAKTASDNNSDTSTCPKLETGPTQNPASTIPVVIATGEKYKEERDFGAAGNYGMGLTRTFRSFLSVNVTPMFGPKWMSEYDFPKLKISTGCVFNAEWGCVPNSATVTFPNGGYYTYNRVSTGSLNYTVRGSSAMGTLMYDPGVGWNLHKDKKTFSYFTNGALDQILSDGGVTLLSFQYGTDPYKPTSVVNAAGQTLTFTWTNGKVSAVADTAGNVWSYAYNANGMLSVATSPGLNADVRTYFYEASNVQFLTGIAINGVRYSTYSYDANSRVAVSGLTGGEERDTFSYVTNPVGVTSPAGVPITAQTTVTSASGQAVTYSFANAQGAKKLAWVSRAQTISCASTAAQTVYDANGWPDYTFDWSGNKTDYTYDAAGNITQVTTAATTANGKRAINPVLARSATA